MEKAKINPTNQHPLVGKFFLSFEDDGVSWQGRILSEVSAGVFLVQLHEWLMGEASDQILVSIPEMKKWKFYENVDDWRYNGDHYSKLQHQEWLAKQ
jgi:hypothetical protein